jgi:ferric-dicitrate binding protein FerR (iron transport regulator)
VTPSSCDEVRELLSGHLAGEGGGVELEAHLASCAACRGLARDLVWQDLALGELAGRGLVRGILSRFRASVEARPVRRSFFWPAAAAALAAGLLLAALYSGSGAPPAGQEARTAKSPPAASREPDPAPGPPRPEPLLPLDPAPERPAPPPPRPEPPYRPIPPVPPDREEPVPAPRPPDPSSPAPRPATSSAIARLVRLRGELRVGGVPAREGMDLLEGCSLESREGSGRSVAEFPDGTRVELHRNTLVSKLGAAEGKRVVVERGSVTARVTPQPKAAPMTVATPHGEATVLGTVFRVTASADPKEGMRLDVLEGQVRLKRADGRTLVVPGGQSAVAAEGRPFTTRRLLPALEELASRLAPGAWAELETDGFEAPAILVRPWAHVLDGVEEAKWDPAQRQLHLLGNANQQDSHYWVFDERSNAWERRAAAPAESWFGPAYDHVAYDPAARMLYFRQHNHDLIYQLDPRTGSWTMLPRMPWNPGEIGALEFHPELGGLVFAGGGAVFAYRFRTKKWDVLARALEFGSTDAFLEYDPVRKTMYFGGGTGSRMLYRLDAAGTVVSLRESPVPLGLKDALVVAEPAGGRLLVLSRPDAKTFHEYDPAQNRWTALDAPPLPVLRATKGAYTAAAPAGGVVLFLVADAQSSGVYVYRHGAGRR